MTTEPGTAAPPPSIPAAFRRPGALEQVWTVLRHEWRLLFFSPRMVAPMLVYAGFGALAMFLMVKTGDALREKAAEAGVGPEALEEGMSKSLGEVLGLVGWGDAATGAEIGRDHVPLLVLSFFAAASYFLPLLVALVSFDQFSNLSTRGARFALLRVRRGGYFAGKALAALASVAGFLFAMWLVVVVVALTKADESQGLYVVREGLRAWALMCVLALPYLAITALVSSLSAPGLAFVATLGSYVALSLANGAAHRLPESLSAPALLAFPWEHAPRLIARDLPTLASGVGGLLVIAAVLYAATAALLGRRDV